jgi:hypothetical protein
VQCKELFVDSSIISSDNAALGRTGGDLDFLPPEIDEAAASCPRCEAKLIDPQGLGWCKECGYCKTMEEDKKRVPEQAAAAQQTSPLGVVEFGQLVGKMPGWAWVMAGGVFAVAALNALAGSLLADEGLPRALWSTMQVAVGFVMIFSAQFWSLVLFAPTDGTLHFKDAIVPGRLWAMTMQKLPRTRGQVWLASWGLACILSGIILVGGLGYWVTCIAKKPVEAPPATSTEEPLVAPGSGDNPN